MKSTLALALALALAGAVSASPLSGANDALRTVRSSMQSAKAQLSGMTQRVSDTYDNIHSTLRSQSQHFSPLDLGPTSCEIQEDSCSFAKCELEQAYTAMMMDTAILAELSNLVGGVDALALDVICLADVYVAFTGQWQTVQDVCLSEEISEDSLVYAEMTSFCLQNSVGEYCYPVMALFVEEDIATACLHKECLQQLLMTTWESLVEKERIEQQVLVDSLICLQGAQGEHCLEILGDESQQCTSSCFRDYVNIMSALPRTEPGICAYFYDDGEGDGYCSAGCLSAWIGDGYCDRACEVEACGFYDGGDCADDGFDDDDFCSEGCPTDNIDDGYCDTDCQVEACKYDGSDCTDDYSTCAVGCMNTYINDGYCDMDCQVEACEYDGSDCDYDACGGIAGLQCTEGFECVDVPMDGCDPLSGGTDCGGMCVEFCSEGCWQENRADGTCDAACTSAACRYDGGDCDLEYCSEGCLWSWINDGACDAACQVEACDNDASDCTDVDGDCALGCQGDWIDDGYCDTACNVAECNYDGDDCACGGIAGLQCTEGFECVDDPMDGCDPFSGGTDCGGICVEIVCGGIAGLECPGGFECVDDPSDGCDPFSGGTDCGGICVELCSEGCSSDSLHDGSCDDACNVWTCVYDYGDCDVEYCSEGCLVNWVDDGFCDLECNVEACGFDGSDCPARRLLGVQADWGEEQREESFLAWSCDPDKSEALQAQMTVVCMKTPEDQWCSEIIDFGGTFDKINADFGDGGYDYDYDYDDDESVSSCDDPCLATECSPACKAEMMSHTSAGAGGCCWVALAEAYSDIIAKHPADNMQEMSEEVLLGYRAKCNVAFVTNVCGLTFEGTCDMINENWPSLAPTAAPTAAPTPAPTAAPTTAPTTAPTAAPTASTDTDMSASTQLQASLCALLLAFATSFSLRA